MSDPLQAFMQEFEGVCLHGDPKTMIEAKPTLNLKVAFGFGDIVYHVASDDGVKGVVMGYLVRPHGLVYEVTWGNNRQEIGHFACELTAEKPL